MAESPKISIRIDEEDLLSLMLILQEARKKDPKLTLSSIIQAAVKIFIDAYHTKSALKRRCNL